MSIPVRVFGDASSVIEKVRELRASGLVQGVHFDFAYNRATWTTDEGVTPRHTVFTFYVDKYATFYALKWI